MYEIILYYDKYDFIHIFLLKKSWNYTEKIGKEERNIKIMAENIKSETRRYNHIISEIDAIYHEIALKQGFSDSAMSVLYTLADNDGTCLISELVKQSGINKQTINSALRKLEKDGIVYLEAAGGKSKRILLTEKGTSVVHETVDKVIAMENKIYGSWLPEEWSVYVELTERYLRELRKEIEEI